MIGKLTDKIVKTRYVLLRDLCHKDSCCRKIYFTDELERAELQDESIGHDYSIGRHYDYNGGYWGKVKVQWYIPKGKRALRMRVIGEEAEADYHTQDPPPDNNSYYAHRHDYNRFRI